MSSRGFRSGGSSKWPQKIVVKLRENAKTKNKLNKDTTTEL